MITRKHARRVAAAGILAGALAVAAPVAGASAAVDPAALPPGAMQLPAAASLPPGLLPSGSVFVPPRVGPISVDIAPTIINGKVVDPGLHLHTPGTNLRPIIVP
jgi:hypothetical protein